MNRLTALAKLPRPKMTMSAVQGRITVMDENSERVGQWGGTECFLSRQTGLGPCLVVRSSRHKKHEGTFFALGELRRVLAMHVAEGKLSIVVAHGKHVCTVFIETSSDLDELAAMARTLQDRRLWPTMERNVASKAAQKVVQGATELSGEAGVLVGNVRRAGYYSSGRLRDPAMAALENENGNTDDDDDSEDEVRKEEKDMAAGGGSTAEQHLLLQQQQQQQQGVMAGTAQTAGSSAEAVVVKDTPSALDAAGAQETYVWSAEHEAAVRLVRRGRNVFVSGAAGTGKTAWLQHLIRVLRSDRSRPLRAEEVVVTATTGVAARVLGGSTVHSFAGIGRGEGTLAAILQRVRGRPEVVRGWRAAAVLIIDEVGVLPAHVFSLLDEVAKAVRKAPGEVFGGLQLVVVGDFLQLPPVARGGEEVRRAFASPAWAQCGFAAVEFHVDYRHARDAGFAACCQDVRRGLYTAQVQALLAQCTHRALDERAGVTATTLLARRKDVAAVNAARLAALEETVYFQRYVSEDYAALPGADLDGEFALPPVLTLKVGAQVILLATINAFTNTNNTSTSSSASSPLLASSLPHSYTTGGTPEAATVMLANGSLGVVTGFVDQAHGPALPRVRFTSGDELIVPLVRAEVSDKDGRVTMSRLQVPLQLAWALTVHRVQGMTLPMARIKLDRSFFEAGQAYVALSRVQAAEDLSLIDFDPQALKAAAPDALRFYHALFPSDYPDPDRAAGDAQDNSKRQKEMEEDRAAAKGRTASPSAARRRRRSGGTTQPGMSQDAGADEDGQRKVADGNAVKKARQEGTESVAAAAAAAAVSSPHTVAPLTMHRTREKSLDEDSAGHDGQQAEPRSAQPQRDTQPEAATWLHTAPFALSTAVPALTQESETAATQGSQLVRRALLLDDEDE